jgi:hypothetical protein
MILAKWGISAVLLVITLGIPFIIITKITKNHQEKGSLKTIEQAIVDLSNLEEDREQ